MSNHPARGHWKPLGSALVLSLLLHLILLDYETADGGTPDPGTQTQTRLYARLKGDSAPAPRSGAGDTPAPRQVANPMPRVKSTRNASAERHPSTTGAASLPLMTDAVPPALTLASELASETVDVKNDGEGMRQYRMSLALAAGRYKAPSAALAGAYQGQMEVRLMIAANGQLEEARLEHGSGNTLLDAAVIDMMARAAGSTPLPAILLGRPLSITLPLEFGVVEEQ